MKPMLLVALLVAMAANGDAPSPAIPVGRFQLVTTEAAIGKLVFKLDTATGRTWLLRGKGGTSMEWAEVVESPEK